MSDDFCGPVDPSLLTGQENHISSNIWIGRNRDKLQIRQSTSLLSQWVLKPFQVHLLQQWGFGMFANPKAVIQNDVSLITSLVERWRPETNTFHFTFGEMTVTLEDVYMLTGLPVVGEAVTNMEDIFIKNTWLYTWPDPTLSVNEREEAFDRGGVKLSFLRERYCNCPDEEDPELLEIYTRGYVFYLCGAILFPTKSNNVAHPRIIPLLLDSRKIVGYAWGAAVLGYLYRNLWEASHKDCKSISGCCTILMLWARERLRPGQPMIAFDTGDTWPRALAWAIDPVGKGKSKYFNVHHNIDAYRGMFDNFDAQWVRWTPYSCFYRRFDPDFQRAMLAGLAHVPVVFFEDVEYQLPERVGRQFGLSLSIPPPPPNDMAKMRLRSNLSFMSQSPQNFIRYVDAWNAFVHNGVGILGPPLHTVSLEEYMDWYYNVTKLKILPPSKPTKDPKIFQQPKDKYDNFKGMDLIMSTARDLSRLCSYDMPHVFHEEILPNFVNKFDDLMLETYGPTYERPDFKSCLPKRKARKIKEASPDEAPFFEEYERYDNPCDTLETFMIGPSAPATQFDEYPIAHLEENITISRDIYDKGSLIKPLKKHKVDWLNAHWWKCAEPKNLPSDCDKKAIISLKPSEQLEDSIVDSYTILLENREKALFGHDGCGAVKYYFMSPWFFQVMVNLHCKNMKKNPLKKTTREWAAIDSDFKAYGTKDKGAMKVTDFDYIIMPVATGGHWILFLWSIKDFRVTLFDPLRDDAPFMSLKELYKKEFYIVEKLVPLMFYRLDEANFKEVIFPEVELVEDRPRQINGVDCGVFISKYIDCILTCNTETWCGVQWDEEVITNFRYRMGWELNKGEARHMSPGSYEARLAGL